MRTLFYPPLRDEQLGEDVVRCGAHSDYGTITFLYQVRKFEIAKCDHGLKKMITLSGLTIAIY